jgi:hypothetical protein
VGGEGLPADVRARVRCSDDRDTNEECLS